MTPDIKNRIVEDFRREFGRDEILELWIVNQLQKDREEILAINEENLKDLVDGVYGDFPARDKVLLAYNRIKYALTDQSELDHTTLSANNDTI